MKLATSELAGKFETSSGHHPSLNPVLRRKKGPPAPSCFPRGRPGAEVQLSRGCRAWLPSCLPGSVDGTSVLRLPGR